MSATMYFEKVKVSRESVIESFIVRDALKDAYGSEGFLDDSSLGFLRGIQSVSNDKGLEKIIGILEAGGQVKFHIEY